MYMCTFTLFAGEYGSMVSGQLNIVRTDVMGGSQSVAIKMLTGMYICICACTQLVYQTRQTYA